MVTVKTWGGPQTDGLNVCTKVPQMRDVRGIERTAVGGGANMGDVRTEHNPDATMNVSRVLTWYIMIDRTGSGFDKFMVLIDSTLLSMHEDRKVINLKPWASNPAVSA
jgi:hypothetical protein